MPNLFVPTPILEFKAVDTGLAALEKPLEVCCGAVMFPDGTNFEQKNLGTAGFFIYKQQSVGSAEIWNEETKLWEPDPGTAVGNLKPRTLIFKQGDPIPWRAMVVAAGQKDQNNQDQFQKAVSLFPHYFFRAYFAATRNGRSFSGLSGASLPVRFISLLDAIRAGVKVGEDQTPEDATEVLLFLRDLSRQFLGTIEIRSESGSSRIEISNRAAGAQKAVIRVLPSGDIEIQPAPGQKLVISGSMEAERIFYQPADTVSGNPVGGKKWLS